MSHLGKQLNLSIKGRKPGNLRPQRGTLSPHGYHLAVRLIAQFVKL